MTTIFSPAKHSLARWQIRYFSIWFTQAVSQIGSGAVQFALIWWITQSTGSATALATASLMGMLPFVLIGPFAGALVDRGNRKSIMLVADSISMACVLVLAYLFAAGRVQLWHIYALMFVRSCCGAFQYNAMSASTALMVPEPHLARVAGLNQMVQGGTGILAPILGALVMALLPMQGILMIDVVTALPALAALIIFVIPQPQADPSAHTAPGGQTSLLGDLRQGAQFLLSWRGLFYICLLAMLLNFLLTPTAALMPLLVKDHFAGTATDLATLESAIGIAIIVGGLLLSVWGGFKRRIVTALVAVIGIGCGSLFIGLAQSHMFGLALAGAAGTGFMQVFANGPLLAMMQSTVPNHMQGRVNSLMSSGSMLMSPLSLAVAGPLADVIGVRAWFIAGGIGCIVIAAMAMFSRDIMNVENRTALPQSIELVEMR